MAERLGLRAAADYTKLPPSTLRLYVSTGKLPATKTPNGRLWFEREALERLFEPVEVKHQPKLKD
jgi:predicted site-specific integrase-resolvase